MQRLAKCRGCVMATPYHDLQVKLGVEIASPEGLTTPTG